MDADESFAAQIADSRAVIVGWVPQIRRLRKAVAADIPDEVVDDGNGRPAVVYSYNESDSPIAIVVGLVIAGIYVWWLSDNLPKNDDDDGGDDGDGDDGGDDLE